MEGILLGFAVVAVLMTIGAVTAAWRPRRAEVVQQGVTPLVYYITNPCLMVILVADTDVRVVAGLFAPLALGIALLTGLCFALFGLLARRSKRDIAVGAMASSYVNAGNIGAPVALYMVGSTAPVVAVLLAQLLVLAPLYLMIFGLLSSADGDDVGRASRRRTILRSLLNPVTLGVVVGSAISLAGETPPDFLWQPITMIGEASIPLMLIIFGMALWQEKPFRSSEHLSESLVSIFCKAAIMPVIAWALAGPVFGLEGTELLGVVAMAALPTAQNVYIFSLQHGMPTSVPKDAIFASSFLALPVTLFAAWLLAV
mgnify:CR=1 FL=1